MNDFPLYNASDAEKRALKFGAYVAAKPSRVGGLIVSVIALILAFVALAFENGCAPHKSDAGAPAATQSSVNLVAVVNKGRAWLRYVCRANAWVDSMYPPADASGGERDAGAE